MAVILKIGEGSIPLTVDSTLVSVDSTMISVDATNYSSDGFSIIITSRVLIPFVTLEFLNELTEVLTIVEGVGSGSGTLMKITFKLDFPIEEGSSYQLTIKDSNSKDIWRGKAYATAQQDLQNFKFADANKNNNNIIKL
jgi:hypothetical protein